VDIEGEALNTVQKLQNAIAPDGLPVVEQKII